MKYTFFLFAVIITLYALVTAVTAQDYTSYFIDPIHIFNDTDQSLYVNITNEGNIYMTGNLTTIGNMSAFDINVTNDVCITGGNCLSSLIVGNFTGATFYDNAGGDTITTAAETIEFDSTLTNIGNSITIENDVNISINEDGMYYIDVGVGVRLGSGTRAGFDIDIQRSINNGAWATIDGTLSHGYGRITSQYHANPAFSLYIYLNAGDKLRILGDSQVGTFVTRAKASSFTIIRMNGAKGDTGIQGQRGAEGTNFSGWNSTQDGPTFLWNTTDFVGIGRTDPITQLHIQTTNRSVTNVITIAGSRSVADSELGILWRDRNVGGVDTNEAGRIFTRRDGTDDEFDLILGGALNHISQEVIHITGLENFVGIGTANPVTRLEISGDSDNDPADAHLTITDSDTTAGSSRPSLRFNDNSGLLGYIEGQDTSPSGFINFRDASDNKLMVIDLDNGNVGIGSTAPTEKLQIIDGNLSFKINDTDAGHSGQSKGIIMGQTHFAFGLDYFSILAQDDDTGISITAGGKGTPSTFGYNFAFASGSTANVRKLNIIDNIANKQTRFVGSIAGAAEAYPLVFGVADTTWSQVPAAFTIEVNTTANTLYLNSSGNVGIGTDSPNELLVINSTTGKAIVRVESDAAAAGFVADRGSANSAVALTAGGNGNFLFDKTDLFLIQARTRAEVLAGSGASADSKLAINGSTGYVGIGTAAPTALLHVNGSAAAVSMLFQNTQTNGMAQLVFKNDAQTFAIRVSGGDDDSLIFRDATNTANRLVVETSGDIGIGMDDPSEKLEVDGNLRLSDDDNLILSRPNGADDFGYQLGHSGSETSAGTRGSFYPQDADSWMTFYVIPNGNPSNAASGLSLFNTDFVADDTNWERLRFQAGISDYVIDADTGGTGQTHPINFQIDSVTKMTLNNDTGFVGIGTSSPDEILHVNGGDIKIEDTSNPNLEIDATGAGGITYQLFSTDNTAGAGGGKFTINDGSAHRFVIDSGNVGINTTTPDSTLNVFGTMNVTDDADFKTKVYIGTERCNVLTNRNGACVDGLFSARGSALFEADKYGIGISSSSFNDSEMATFNIGTGLFDNVSLTFCDVTNDPFTIANVGNILGVFASAESEVATFDILGFINSSCVNVNDDIFGTDDSIALTSATYAFATSPTFFTLDNQLIGINAQRFRINLLASSGTRRALFNIGTAAVGTHGLDIDMNVNGFGGTAALHILHHTNGSDVNLTTSNGLIIEADLSDHNNGTYTALNLPLIASGNGMVKVGIEMDEGYDFMIRSGEVIEANFSWYYNTTATINVTDEFTDSTILTNVFELNGSETYHGNDVNFTRITFSLSTESTVNNNLIFYYCNGTDYLTFTPSDGTDGMRNSGTVEFASPVDRGICNFRIDGTAFENAANLTYIAIQRTKNIVPTTAVVRLVSIHLEGSGEQMFVAHSSIRMQPRIVIPYICETKTRGAWYYNDDINEHCACRGDPLAWEQMDGGGATGCS